MRPSSLQLSHECQIVQVGSHRLAVAGRAPLSSWLSHGCDLQEFQRKSQAVAGQLLRGLAIGLGQPEDYFLGVRPHAYSSFM